MSSSLQCQFDLLIDYRADKEKLYNIIVIVFYFKAHS